MLWFPEGQVWPGRRSAWLGLLNPTGFDQRVLVTLMTDGPAERRTVTVRPQRRAVVELGALFGLTQHDQPFGLEVLCGDQCAASLVMWDAEFRYPNPAVPIVGCRDLP